MNDESSEKLHSVRESGIGALASADAKRVFAFLDDNGIAYQDWTIFDFLALDARLKTGAMKATGLSNYIPLETGASKAAAEYAAECRDPEKAADVIKCASSLDALMTQIKHFTSYSELERLSTGPDEVKGDFFVSGTLVPSSPGAKRWAAELNNPLHYLPSTDGAATPREKNVASEDETRAIRAKPMITESDAAVLMSVSRKALSNKRRAGEIPRNLYRQKCGKGKVLYTTKEVVAFIESGLLKTKRR